MFSIAILCMFFFSTTQSIWPNNYLFHFYLIYQCIWPRKIENRQKRISKTQFFYFGKAAMNCEVLLRYKNKTKQRNTVQIELKVHANTIYTQGAQRTRAEEQLKQFCRRVRLAAVDRWSYWPPGDEPELSVRATVLLTVTVPRRLRGEGWTWLSGPIVTQIIKPISK
jgi:hypothetical protein